MLKNYQEEKSREANYVLNDQEFNSKKLVLTSSPRVIFIQVSGPCNSNCVFCSRGGDYEIFNLNIHRERFEIKLYPYISRAETLIFTGSGEFLLLPEAEEIINFFNISFPHVQKQFATNGTALTNAICEKILQSKSKYTIHVSLHASNSALHRVITRNGAFSKIIEQLRYLLALRKDKSKLELRLIFVANTLNIKDLPNFIKFAAGLGIDRVICYYNYIYVPAQKYLSCYFQQETTNLIFREAEELGKQLGVPIDLPPRFGLDSYPVREICREPWSQVMIDSAGHILPCDASEDCPLNLKEANSFMVDIWNSRYFQELRNSLVQKRAHCFKHCFRANPVSVNDFSSHVIHRGKNKNIDILWGDNF